MIENPSSYRNAYSGGSNWTHARSAGRELRRTIQDQLRTTRFGHHILAFKETESTNTAAAMWAAEGAPEGAVVTAEVQTRGRGRFGRRWLTAPGQNLTFSVILRPDLPPEGLGLIVLAASIAVAEGITSETDPIQPQIKWPNDILLNGRKCCGMLMETSTGGSPSQQPALAVLGIGVNVNQDAFPPELASTATSLLLETGRLFTRTGLLARILNLLEETYDAVRYGGGHEVRHRYVGMMAGIGARVHVRNLGRGESLTGTVRGITGTGALVLETDVGVRYLPAGDVTFQDA